MRSARFYRTVKTMHDQSWVAFTEHVTKGIIDHRQREELRMELYSHLQELSDSLLCGYNNEAEARTRALKLMGNEKTLCKMYTVQANGWIYKLAAVQLILVILFYYGFPLKMQDYAWTACVTAAIVNCLLSGAIYFCIGKQHGLNGITFPYTQLLILPLEILMLGTINPMIILRYFIFSFIGLVAGDFVRKKSLKQKDTTY